MTTTSAATPTATPAAAPTGSSSVPSTPGNSTPGTSPAPAPAPAAPTATAPETTEDPKFHKAWKGLAAAEKALKDRGEKTSATEKKAAQWEAAFAIEDPVARVDALAELTGKKDLWDAANKAAISRKRTDPAAAKALSEVELLKQDLAVARALPLVQQGASPEDVAAELGIDLAALQALVDDPRHAPRFSAANKRHEAELSKTEARQAAQIEEWVAAQREPDGQVKYDLISRYPDAPGKVYRLIVQHYNETLAAGKPVILSAEEAADIIEQGIFEVLQKGQGSRKLNPATPETAGKPPVPPPPASRPASPKTLGNAASQDSSAASGPMTEAQRLKEASKVLDAIRASRKT